MSDETIWAQIGRVLVDEPFRVIEMLLAPAIALYGLYLLAGYGGESLVGASVYSLSFNPELNAEIAGTLYVMAGVALALASKSGVNRAREVSTMTLFFGMLWSILFRAVEIGFLPGSLMLFYIGLVLAAVDFAQLRGRRE